MNKFKKVPGPKLTNSRNYTYSTCCDYCTKLLPRSNGTNVEVRNNIENIEFLYNRLSVFLNNI